MQTTTSQPGEAISFKRSCAKCAHFNVCTLTRAIAPLLANWEEGHRPFEPANLAGICLEYITRDAVDTGNL
jgi:hypothetical protein